MIFIAFGAYWISSEGQFDLKSPGGAYLCATLGVPGLFVVGGTLTGRPIAETPVGAASSCPGAGAVVFIDDAPSSGTA